MKSKNQVLGGSEASFSGTPGPWKFDGVDSIVTNDEVICNVYGAAVDDQVGYANARLIAAAPCLLSACREAVEDMESDLSALNWSDECRAVKLEILAKLEAAINKATT